MNKAERRITLLLIILFGLILASLLTSCQLEFPQEDCQEQNEYWENVRDQELQELWATCPGKCDFREEEKAIYKKYNLRMQECK